MIKQKQLEVWQVILFQFKSAEWAEGRITKIILGCARTENRRRQAREDYRENRAKLGL